MCGDGDLRLVDGESSGQGRVEVCFNNTYGSICADFWDERDAEVVCGQLGFLRNGQDSLKPHGSITSRVNFHYVGSQPSMFEDTSASVDIFLSTLHCDGTEAKLIDCSSSAGTGCNNNELAGVKCEGNQ